MKKIRKDLKHMDYYHLLDLYEQEVKRKHYDPVDSFPELVYPLNEIRDEIEGRLSRLDSFIDEQYNY
jgi:hypothetical protein